jgi:5-methyltetrahydropteroyltriglutamate--homocysteine methyltransferase
MPVPTIRADHVGSLLRPDALKRAYGDYRDKRIDAEKLQEQTERAIVDAVRQQETTGLRVTTDGEFRRGSWFLGLVDAIDGIALEQVPFRFSAEGVDSKTWHGPVIRGKLKRARPIVVDDFKFLRATTTQTPKVTLPTPSVLHFFGGDNGIDKKAYPDVEAFFADLSAIYRAEIADLHAAGCRYLQLDEVPLTLLCDPHIREACAARGQDPDLLVDLYIAAINDPLMTRPSDMCVVIHLCRGNYRGRWMGSGSYEPIAERMFNALDVDAFLLEFDSERAGTFEPLRFLPATKRAFLGVISSKSSQIETADDVARRIDEAFRYAPPERLGVCPQCGFASSAGGNPISAEVQWAKLALTATTAQRVWGHA